MHPQELFGNDYQEFCEVDPFNKKNEVRGYISRKSNEYYGALIITHISNRKVRPQLIMGTPKMHYPFDRRADDTRNYVFPSCKDIEIYEKLDGTNILGYSYMDGNDFFISYKTRLRPFVNAGSRWGDFYSMWLEVAGQKLDDIRAIIRDEQCNLSFELYGARNPHLVMYKIPLSFALLFGVTNTGRIIPPVQIKGIEELNPLVAMRIVDKDYVWNYEQLQKELNSGLSQVEDGYYTGIEGTVWYLNSLDGRCIQIKCKPEIIEAIHFSAGAKNVNRNVILATCWNALENTDTLTIEFVKQLLTEEFKPELVEASHRNIEKCIDFINSELHFRQSVLLEYQKLNMNIHLNKVAVMRALSSKFDKGKMQKVYTAVINFG